MVRSVRPKEIDLDPADEIADILIDAAERNRVRPEVMQRALDEYEKIMDYLEECQEW
jgi:hypothetical protein